MASYFERLHTSPRVVVDGETCELKSRRFLLKSSSLLLLTSGLELTPFVAEAYPNGKLKPMGSVESRFDDHAASTGWLPFQKPDDRHLVIRVQLNGVSTEAVLDSGVGVTVLDINFAAKLGLHRRAEFQGIGLTGGANGSVAEGILIRVGNLSVRTQTTSLFDMAALSAAAGRQLVAIIGRDLFGASVVDIDFAKRQIAFRSPAATLDHNGLVLPLNATAQNMREIPISIERSPTVPAVFDLGSDTPLYVSAEYATQSGLLDGKRTSTSLSAGIEGTTPNRVAVLKHVMLGKTTFHDVPVEIPERWTHQVPAFIGLPILGRFRLGIDFRRDRLSILPLAELINLPFRKDRSGVGAVVSGGGLKVANVAPGSPAAQAGMRVGDEIVAINGQQLGPAYFRSRPREGSKPVGTVLRLRLADGRTINLVLADYF